MTMYTGGLLFSWTRCI